MMNFQRIKEWLKDQKKKIEVWYKWDVKPILNIPKSTYICLKYPFLYPRNVFTGNHYDCWRIWQYHRDNWSKAYEFNRDTYEAVCINKWLAFKIKFLDFINDWVLQIFHCLPTHTLYEQIPTGWRIAFGKQLCDEIKKALKENNYLYKYRVTQIKEKWGGLRWYDNGGPKKVFDIIDRYENLSMGYCINCGKPAPYMSRGYILPYCRECAENESIYGRKIIDISDENAYYPPSFDKPNRATEEV